MSYNITPEELNSVLSFVNGENDDVLKTDIPRRFMSVSFAFESKVLDAMRVARGALKAKERAFERIQGRLSSKVVNEEFGEQDLSSYDIARVVVYYLREKDRFESLRQVNFIMYHFYARWLHETMNRPWENDRPALQEWGPQFWGAANRLSKERIVTSYDDVQKIAQKPEYGPMMVAIIRNVVAKYCMDSERSLQAGVMDSFPYRNALKRKENAGAKWGEKISDSDLFNWKQ